ncbi:iron-sulfur cluster assembly 1 homolog, mitochondrial-like [Daktulosphaira vitifoliae]|uniref:iron-sulfur cluster assembly 1 homolog, mitochondrial-like n=1 Tax=Daktulosphaira vitifoliae TaxID=58002 RepID=UPI0021AA44B6|nr:iron-sulfur cluster assembly 1 homolog, mitochondrial-like [Daktulosphaira vitifoliae]
MTGRIASASVRTVLGAKQSTKAALILTQSAKEQLKKILFEKPDCIGLKIGVKQRGCNGYSYIIDYAKEKHKLDEEVVQDGIRVFIDRRAQLTLLGTEMDYVQSKLSSEFVFYNPNIKGTCGCGESFNI